MLTLYFHLVNVDNHSERRVGLGLWCLTSLSAIVQLYHGVSFIGGGNRNSP